ncbi:TetR family transcriptional regulator [Saccharothrix sp. NRRL B-16348]|uniref:TetR family transcriptional regulator n=1 Tax=Saccharothrix sp. NRRL B-16348 TaxID=1415542 RepID=UPI0006AF54B6|nr:TetR family transcriptional regulator [Saccharothrix sp. NRRL B-16348]
MAWNTEETRRRLKEAAVVEFAAHGLAGTRVERIAARAGVNKERLYNYFGDKEQLFHAVLSDELAKIAAAVPFDPESLRDVGEYAGRCFDYHVANPHLVRLLQWEALAYGDGAVPDEEGRAAHYQRKVEAFRTAQSDGAVPPSPDAADLVLLIMSLTSWWQAVPQVARMVTGPLDLAHRRAAVVEAARRMVSAQVTATR